MKDQLCRALVLENRVRIFICKTTDMVQEARDRFDLHPCACAALGRTLTIGSMMGSMLKDEQEMLNITINGHGPIGTIMVDAYSNGDVCGFCSNPHVEDIHINDKKLNVGAVVGKNGTLTVTKNLHMQDNFSGTVQLQTGEIGEDFAYYFAVSEQTPTAVSVGVLVDPNGNVLSAGGLILQMLPDATEEDICICENIIQGLKPMSTLILDYEDVGLKRLVQDIFDAPNLLSTQEIHYSCPCSKERMASGLSCLKDEDLKEMIEVDKGCSVTCNFCNEQYSFPAEDLKQILEKKHV